MTFAPETKGTLAVNAPSKDYACLRWNTAMTRYCAGALGRQSRAKASIGSSFAALRAGRKPKTIPIRVEQVKATMMDPEEKIILKSELSKLKER